MKRVVYILVFLCFSCLIAHGQTISVETSRKLFFDILTEALSSPIVEDALVKQRNGTVYPLYLVYDKSFSRNIEMDGFAVDTSKVQKTDFVSRNSVLQVTSFEFDPEFDVFRLKLQYNSLVNISIKASRLIKSNGKRITSILISTD
jgi:hypothetical protein